MITDKERYGYEVQDAALLDFLEAFCWLYISLRGSRKGDGMDVRMECLEKAVQIVDDVLAKGEDCKRLALLEQSRRKALRMMLEGTEKDR